MIPNMCFPLFPVVDYTRFSQDYYNENPYRIYQRGLARVFRGITHLIIYRFVFLHMTIDPLEVDGLANMLALFTTWFLHMYQWFWLRGPVLFEWHVVLFWGILGLVVINFLYCSRQSPWLSDYRPLRRIWPI